ncbi:MAG: hypothetical protein LBF58_04435 [Deltaproteobacteria bacterium]|jgi:Fe-only nitrogenase accessory protein AnfO|nr:hypothetical protein [Deltaproteobacteria bacterium]
MPTDDYTIAVTLSETGDLSTVPETQRIELFHKGPADWVVDREIPFDFAGVAGLCQMRKRLHAMIELLGGAKALVSRGYPGISMEVLSRAGLTLYELNGFRSEVLPAIMDGAGPETDLGPPPPNAPYETEEGSGDYYLDLREALNAYPELTTKKILRPFLDAATFASLKVIYDHLPPWLPPELKSRGLSWDSRRIPGGVLIEIDSGILKPCGQT